MEQSLLRLFHPAADCTMVSRSYFVNDEVTGRGVVQYSFGLVFSGAEENGRFLQCPRQAFERQAYEEYGSFVKRIDSEGKLAYSGAYDPLPEDYAAPCLLSREKWVSLGFNKENFCSLFTALGKAIAPGKGYAKVAVLLPAGADSEALIYALLAVLPPWLKRKFGAVSRWAGPLDGSSATAISGMQLACYVGEQPPYDTTAAIVDLTGRQAHKNLGQILGEQRQLAEWYWDNIEDAGALSGLVEYMEAKYQRQLMDKMPFTVFAHCFWLWLHLHKNLRPNDPGYLTFAMAAHAISSLVSAFGINIEKYFSNRPLLMEIFKAYRDNLASDTVSNVNAGFVHSICVLAKGEFWLKLGDIKARELIKPLFDELLAAQKWEELEPLLQYYAKILAEEKPQDRVYEAVGAFLQLLNCPDKKCADEAVAISSKYAIAILHAALAMSHGDDIDKHRKNINIYKTIAAKLQEAGRKVGADLTAWDNLQLNEGAARLYYDVLKFNREEIENQHPPGVKQLDNIINALQRLPQAEKAEALQDILTICWQAEELKDQAQQQKYIYYLRDNKKLALFVNYNVGVAEIRGACTDELNAAFAGRKFSSVDEKIEELYRWHCLLHEYGFAQNDPIFGLFAEKYQIIGDMLELCRHMSPEAGRKLVSLTENSPYKKIAALINGLDEHAAAGGELIQICREWDEARELLAARIEYWFKRRPNPPAEWALTRTLVEARILGQQISSAQVAEFYLTFYGGERAPKQDLEKQDLERQVLERLYEALWLIDDSNRYGSSTSRNLNMSINLLIKKTIDQLPSIAVLYKTADKFQALHGGGHDNINSYLSVMGQEICGFIISRHEKKRSALPFDVLYKFNPYRYPNVGRQYASNALSPLESKLSLATIALLLLGAGGSALLLLNAGGGITRTLWALMPARLIIAMAIAALLLCSAAAINVSQRHSKG
jgi:hypothetical protein